jgi:hypothetical protein
MLKNTKILSFPFMFPLIFIGIDVHEIYLYGLKQPPEMNPTIHPMKKIPTNSSKDTLKPKPTPLKDLL